MKAFMNLQPATRTQLFPRSGQISLSPIKEMELRASRIPGVVSLAQGIPNFDTPEPITRYVNEKIASGVCSRYSLPPGLLHLREAIAETLLDAGMRYDPQTEIIVSCGAIEAISATLLATLEPGEEVIVPAPGYASYAEAIRIAHGVARFVPLIEEENWALDTEAISKAVNRRTKAILYANPNNPTGTIYTRVQLEALAELAVRHGLLLIADEVYKDFVYTDDELFTPATIEAVRDHVVRVFSFSKAYGMTGWRVGFLHSAADNVREILKVHDALVTCAPVTAQYGAIAALGLGDELIAPFRSEFRERRDRTLRYLDALSSVLDYQKPNSSYFVFPRVKDTVRLARDSRSLAIDILEKARVALVPGVAFGPPGESHLRLSYSRASQDIDVAFERLNDYFGQARRKPVRAPDAALSTRAVSKISFRGAVRRAAVAWLDAMARIYLARIGPRTVAIAGLQGKTLVKRALRESLAPLGAIRANPRSQNTDVGLPLAILGVEIGSGRGAAARAVLRGTWRAVAGHETLDVLVLEMGLGAPGDARSLLRAAVPDVLVLMPLAPSFPNDFSFLQSIGEEIAVLARAVKGNSGTVIASAGDPLLVSALDKTRNIRWIRREQVRREGNRSIVDLETGPCPIEGEPVGESAELAVIVGAEVLRALDVEPERIPGMLSDPHSRSGWTSSAD